MDSSKYSRGAYMKADDLEHDVPLYAEITGVSEREITPGESRLVLETTEGSVVLNKTNVRAVQECYGVETDIWEGKRIKLCREQTMFGGKRVDCIRVYGQPPSKQQEQRPMKPLPKQEKRPAPKPEQHEDIPF